MRTIYFLIMVTSIFLFTGCQSLFFHPDKTLYYNPMQVKYSVKDYSIETSDNITLHAWSVKSKIPDRKGVILFFHGNARNISTESLQLFWLADHGYDLFIPDYRGYGISQGKPTIELFMKDSIDIMDAFMELYEGDENIIVWGQSLGGQAAAAVAANSKFADHISKLVLDSTFISWSSIGKEVASSSFLTYLFQYPVKWSFPDNNSAIEFLPKSRADENIFIHSRGDEFINYNNTVVLFNSMPDNYSKDMHIYEKDSHANIIVNIHNKMSILNFLE